MSKSPLDPNYNIIPILQKFAKLNLRIKPIKPKLIKILGIGHNEIKLVLGESSQPKF